MDGHPAELASPAGTAETRTNSDFVMAGLREVAQLAGRLPQRFFRVTANRPKKTVSSFGSVVIALA
jgi:hypothetical protein